MKYIISNGIKNGCTIRVPKRGDEKYHIDLTVNLFYEEIHDKAIITEIHPFEFHDEIKLVSFRASGFNCPDGQVMMLYFPVRYKSLE
jgi:hypothetical protein